MGKVYDLQTDKLRGEIFVLYYKGKDINLLFILNLPQDLDESYLC